MKQESQLNPRLTASELGNLWSAYMNDSTAICVIKYMLQKAEDEDVKEVLTFALELSQKHVNEITDIFNQEEQPIPEGFTDNDVNPDAPRLFSDTFSLIYLQSMSRVGLLAYGAALPLAPRQDTFDYFQKCIKSSIELSEKIMTTMLQKGVYTRSPYIPHSEKVEFVEKQSYMHGWLGKHRPLAAMEISGLFMSQMINIFAKVLQTGYAQVAESDQVRKYLENGKNISSKHVDVLSEVLKDEDLSSPQTWDSEVTTSTVPPFSDKLMMFQSRSLYMGGIATYGASMSTSARHDLIPIYARLTAELGKYGDKGVEIMIQHNWMEQPPQAADRTNLIQKKQ